MQVIDNREGLNVREGKPRAVCLSLCTKHDYLTFSGECSCTVKHIKYRYAIIGTDYGWLHDTAGDTKMWDNASFAKSAIRRYVGL